MAMQRNYTHEFIADRSEIIDLNIQYALAVDGFQLESVMDCWHPEGIFDERETGYDRYEGEASLRAFYKDVVFAPTAYMSHLMCNHLVERIEGNKAFGTVLARADVLNRKGVRIWFTIKYEDEYIRTDRWRFLKRIVRMGIAPDISTYDDSVWKAFLAASAAG